MVCHVESVKSEEFVDAKLRAPARFLLALFTDLTGFFAYFRIFIGVDWLV
jgi:hypothetical protein